MPKTVIGVRANRHGSARPHNRRLRQFRQLYCPQPCGGHRYPAADRRALGDEGADFAAALDAFHPPESHALDAGGDLAAALARIAPDIVVHTAGPFQKQDHRVARACIAQGCHYIDLADARDFVATIDAVEMDESYLLIADGRAYTASRGYLELCRILGGWWHILRVAAAIPERFRDWVYALIARHRYRWFGKTDYCMLLTAEQRQRLL